MSLPRADYDPRRVCVNPCPNFTLGLGKHKRTVGVYLAGALVRSPPIRKWIPNPKLIVYLSLWFFLMHTSMGNLPKRISRLLSCGIARVRLARIPADTARTRSVVHHRQLDFP